MTNDLYSRCSTRPKNQNLSLIIFFILLVFSSSLHSQVPKLWGMAPFGGAGNGGTIYSIDEDGNNFNVAYSLDAASGTIPRCGLCLAPNGKLYGCATMDGLNSVGTVFSFDPSNNNLHVIYNFDYNKGAYPWAGLMLAKNGWLYGCTYGGFYGNGNIIVIVPGVVDQFSSIYSFDGSLGSSPTGKLVQGFDGNLYGLATYDGGAGRGTIFSYNLNSHQLTDLHDFTGPDGAQPFGNLVQASDTNLYGVTNSGGSNGVGVLFKFNPVTNIYTKLVDFDSTNGKKPWNGLIQVSGTMLYGVTPNGGSGNSGIIYSYDISTGTYSVEYNFALDASVPFGSLLKGSDGNLYGTTANGGDFAAGTIFRYNLANDALIVMHIFDGTDGYGPQSELIEVPAPQSVDNLAEIHTAIYPNPSKGKLTIELHDLNTASAVISNTFGQLVSNFPLYQKKTTINLNLPAGIYFLTIRANGKSTTRKLAVE